MIGEQLTIAEREARYTSGAYAKRPLTLVRGAGAHVWDDAGNRYLDMTSSMGVAILGHAHPAVANALAAQAQTLISCPEAFYNDRRAELYDVLSALLPGGFDRFFLCNSGAEAIEAGLKVARLLTGRTGIVAVKRAFHGRTLGALATTWNPQYREPFAGWTPPTTAISPHDLTAAEAAVDDSTAVVVVEAVQGEGGVYPLDAAWLQGLRRLCDERGALLLVDEIQAGLGRTGTWWAFAQVGITPDLIALGKGIAGGVPMGALVWRSALGSIESGTHGSTFGGNPLACAASIATLRTLQAMDAPTVCATLGQHFLAGLHALNAPSVREVRGRGLMLGLELRGRVTPVLQALQARGVLALPAGKTVLRLLPPYVTTIEQADEVLAVLAEVLHDANA